MGGLGAASQKQAPSVASLTAYARWLTIISWLTYPFVYIIKMLGISGVAATAGEQIGYSCSDVLAKAVFGVLIWASPARSPSSKRRACWPESARRQLARHILPDLAFFK